MATFNGSTVASSTHGGWRAVVEYTVSETATSYTVTVGVVRACPVDATGKTSLQDASTQGAVMTQNVSVSATGKSATTKTTAPTRSQYPYPSIEWYSHISLYWTFNKTMTWAKGHADASKTITVKEVLGNISLWYSTSSSIVSDEKNVPGTSTATLNVTIPALDSYTVTLDAQGGTGAASTLTKWYGEALPLPQPAKDGYSFAGWAKSSAPTTVVYQPGDSYTSNSAASLVAVWTPVISAAVITQVYAARDDGSFTWDSQTGTHTSASDDGEYVYIRAWWRVDGADAATISLGATMADTSTVWTGATRQVSKPGTGELYIEGVAEWGTTQTALVANQYDVTVTLSTGAGNPSDSRGATVSTAFFTIDVLAGGHGIAFGKPATQQVFDVGMETNFDHDVKVLGTPLVPVGTILDYAAATAPSGYLVCDGSAVSRTDYAALFAVIGTTWGSGDGSTTFNVPNLCGRTTIGTGTGDYTSASTRTLGQRGGAEALQSHSHGLPDSDSSYQAFKLQSGVTGVYNLQYHSSGNDRYAIAASNSANIKYYSETGNTGAGGSGNMQPFATVTKIIRAI